MAKNVLFVGTDYRTFKNFRLDLAKELQGQGWHVDAYLNVDMQEKLSLEAEGIGIFCHDLENDKFSLVETIRVLLSVQRLSADYEVVVSYFLTPNVVLGILTLLGLRRRSISFVEGLGRFGGLPKRWTQTVFCFFYSLVLSKINSVIVLNHGDRNDLIQINWFMAARVQVFPGIGVDQNLFRPPERRSKTAGKFKICFAGRLLFEKGVDTLLEVAKAVELSRPDLTFEFVGAPVSDGRIGLTELQTVDIATRYQNVRFLGYCDLSMELGNADLVCLPTRYGEGMPRVILEAMAMGKPVLVSAIPACSELVEDGVSGFIVPALDVGSMADQICRISTLDTESLSTIGKNARKRVVESFSNEVVLPRFVELILESNKT